MTLFVHDLMRRTWRLRVALHWREWPLRSMSTCRLYEAARVH